mmetsp:Transcript_54464/g.167680  ORF Transcript_54464/g.167680 Transcript_54464/m.167680 type:complete len:233 (+) Transcript_54464:384-1082(+)
MGRMVGPPRPPRACVALRGARRRDGLRDGRQHLPAHVDHRPVLGRRRGRQPRLHPARDDAAGDALLCVPRNGQPRAGAHDQRGHRDHRLPHREPPPRGRARERPRRGHSKSGAAFDAPASRGDAPRFRAGARRVFLPPAVGGAHPHVAPGQVAARTAGACARLHQARARAHASSFGVAIGVTVRRRQRRRRQSVPSRGLRRRVPRRVRVADGDPAEPRRTDQGVARRAVRVV